MTIKDRRIAQIAKAAQELKEQMLQEGVQNVPVPSTPVALEAYLQAKADVEAQAAPQDAAQAAQAVQVHDSKAPNVEAPIDDAQAVQVHDSKAPNVEAPVEDAQAVQVHDSKAPKVDVPIENAQEKGGSASSADRAYAREAVVEVSVPALRVADEAVPAKKNTWLHQISTPATAVVSGLQIIYQLSKVALLAGKNIGSGAIEPVTIILNEAPQFFACELLKPSFTLFSDALGYLGFSNPFGRMGHNICAATTPSRTPAHSILSHSNVELAYKIVGGVLAVKDAASAVIRRRLPMVPIGLAMLPSLAAAKPGRNKKGQKRGGGGPEAHELGDAAAAPAGVQGEHGGGNAAAGPLAPHSTPAEINGDGGGAEAHEPEDPAQAVVDAAFGQDGAPHLPVEGGEAAGVQGEHGGGNAAAEPLAPQGAPAEINGGGGGAEAHEPEDPAQAVVDAAFGQDGAPHLPVEGGEAVGVQGEHGGLHAIAEPLVPQGAPAEINGGGGGAEAHEPGDPAQAAVDAVFGQDGAPHLPVEEGGAAEVQGEHGGGNAAPGPLAVAPDAPVVGDAPAPAAPAGQVAHPPAGHLPPHLPLDEFNEAGSVAAVGSAGLSEGGYVVAHGHGNAAQEVVDPAAAPAPVGHLSPLAATTATLAAGAAGIVAAVLQPGSGSSLLSSTSQTRVTGSRGIPTSFDGGGGASGPAHWHGSGSPLHHGSSTIGVGTAPLGGQPFPALTPPGGGGGGGGLAGYGQGSGSPLSQGHQGVAAYPFGGQPYTASTPLGGGGSARHWQGPGSPLSQGHQGVGTAPLGGQPFPALTPPGGDGGGGGLAGYGHGSGSPLSSGHQGGGADPFGGHPYSASTPLGGGGSARHWHGSGSPLSPGHQGGGADPFGGQPYPSLTASGGSSGTTTEETWIIDPQGPIQTTGAAGGGMIMRVVNTVLPTRMVAPTGVFAIAYGGFHDYTKPNEPSLLYSLGYGASWAGIVAAMVTHPTLAMSITITYCAISIVPSYVAHNGFPNLIEMVLHPGLAVDHAKQHAQPDVIELLEKSFNQSINELRDVADRISLTLPQDDGYWMLNYIPGVAGLRRDTLVMKELSKAWSPKLADHLNNTISEARSANQTVLFSENKTDHNATHVMINCGDYAQARNLLHDVMMEQRSLLGRFVEGTEETLAMIVSFILRPFRSEVLEPSRICYDAVGANFPLHTSPSADSLNLKLAGELERGD